MYLYWFACKICLHAKDAEAQLLTLFTHLSVYCPHKGSLRKTKILAKMKFTQRWKDVVFATLSQRWHYIATTLLQHRFSTLQKRCQLTLGKRSFPTSRQRRYKQSYDVMTTLWHRLCFCWVVLLSELICLSKDV